MGVIRRAIYLSEATEIHQNCTVRLYISLYIPLNFVSRAKKRENWKRYFRARVINIPRIPACLIIAPKNDFTPEIRNRDPVIMPFQRLL